MAFVLHVWPLVTKVRFITDLLTIEKEHNGKGDNTKMEGNHYICITCLWEIIITQFCVILSEPQKTFSYPNHMVPYQRAKIFQNTISQEC